MTSQFLSSQLKPKRDNENCSLGAIFLSLVGLKVEFPFFFPPSWQGTISWETAFFFVDVRHIHTLSRSLSISKQTLFRDGRDSKAPGASEEKNPQVMPGTQNNSQKKKLAAGEERNPNLKKREGKKKEKKAGHVVLSRLCVCACWRALVLDQHRSSLRLARRRRSLVTVFVTCRGKIPGGGRVGDGGGGLRGRAGGAKLLADVWEQTPRQSGLEATLQCG